MPNLSEGLIQQGIQQGFQKGKLSNLIECVKNLIDFGLSLEDIFKALKIDDAMKQEVLLNIKEGKEL